MTEVVRGRPRTKTEQERAEANRRRVSEFRSKGMRVDLQLSVQGAREMDRLCNRFKASRSDIVEALVRLAADVPDVTALQAYISVRSRT